MRLVLRKTRLAFYLVGAAAITVIFGIASQNIPNTFAGENDTTEVYARYVTIHDENKTLTIKTTAVTVREALERAKIDVAETDIVEPALSERITADNFNVNIYRARPVILEDNAVRKAFYSASYDGPTLAEEAGITLYDGDEVILSTGNFLETADATVYKVVRNGGNTLTAEIILPFTEETVNDPALAAGKSTLIQAGEDGRKVIKYRVNMVDGIEVSREIISEEIVVPAVSRVTAVGTKNATATVAAALSSPSENEQIAWDYLTSHGFSKTQAAGIMGNLMQEHGFQTSDTAGGIGIAQWTGSRRLALLSLENPYSVYTQLDYLMSELNGRESAAKNAILATNTIETATQAFQNKFERCGICRESKRISYAYAFYERYAK